MHRDIEEVEFTIFDTETTGLDPLTGDRIAEIAALRVKGSQRIGVFQSLINPGRPISAEAFAVNRITEEMISKAPTSETVLPKFLEFSKGSCLCSYNLPFDLKFLENEFSRLHISFDKGTELIDVLLMARRLLPKLERHALWFVAQSIGIKTAQQHRALGDVDMTWQVFTSLKDSLKSKGVQDFKNFLNLFSLNGKILEDLNNQKISRIQQAIDLGMKIRIKYLSSQDARVSEREVIPKEFIQNRRRDCLVGFCCLKQEERAFRVDNILGIEIV
jgi:DNA polymerase-3 subunit epsilon